MRYVPLRKSAFVRKTVGVGGLVADVGSGMAGNPWGAADGVDVVGLGDGSEDDGAVVGFGDGSEDDGA
jgi:hypothetical protein